MVDKSINEKQDTAINGKPPTARSYRTAIVDDNFSVQLNIKWLGQILFMCGFLVYGYWNLISRIESLEQGMDTSNSQIQELVSKHIEDEQQRYKKMEEELLWYQKELNLNPLSWRKKKKRK